MDLVVLKVGNREEILLLRGILESNQIDAIVETRQGAGFVMRAGNLLEEYSLLVRDADEARARELLEAFSSD